MFQCYLYHSVFNNHYDAFTNCIFLPKRKSIQDAGITEMQKVKKQGVGMNTVKYTTPLQESFSIVPVCI